MNAYELNRDSYEEYLKQNPDDPNADYIRRKAKVNGLLAECDPEDRFEMYNTGAFNEITAGYVKKAMRDLDFSQHQIDFSQLLPSLLLFQHWQNRPKMAGNAYRSANC